MKKYGHNDPRNVASLLSGISNKQGWRKQLDIHSIFLHWDKLVDTDTSVHARPLKILHNVLWLEISNSAWMQQFQFQKIHLLEILNKSLRLSRLEDIRFTLSNSHKTVEPAKQTVHFVQPSPAAQDCFQKQISTIEDEKIRDSLMSLWYLSHSCQKS